MGQESRYHRSLERQLRRLRLGPEQTPDPRQWSAILDLVSTAYDQADADRYTLERSIEISSSEMRAMHDVLRRQARHDVLTGLPNRCALAELLSEALSRSRRNGRDVAVLFVDLDGFKVINDSLGHAAGDDLLVRAAERICGVVREGDIVARLGGDEFVVICPEIDDIATATGIAGRINEQLRLPFRSGGQDSVVSASVGIALASAGEPSPDEMLRQADMAMYQAKTGGRSRYVIFDERMRLQAQNRLATENALRRGIQCGQLTLHYQPIVRLTDQTTIGVEALVRWRRPGHGLVIPDSFIPIAEQSQLITALDCWVVQEACGAAAAWPDDQMTVAVNLSARDLLTDDVVHAVSTALQDTGLRASRLVMELTETTLMSDSAVISTNISRIDELGVQIAIDDFGTGYSSLSYLGRLPAHTIKIDRSFVAVLDKESSAVPIVRALIEMAHALNMSTIAEGVERDTQAAALGALACDAAQGFMFARPTPDFPRRAGQRDGVRLPGAAGLRALSYGSVPRVGR